jgi:short-subunit dehydrogenase
MDSKRYGPWALITGGSEGVGASFARKLAACGLNLLLVARKPGPLAETAQAARRFGVSVRTLELDLTAPDMMEKVRAASDDIEIGMLICNAGSCNRVGTYLDLDYAETEQQIALNVVGPARLAHHFGRKMRDRGRGGIILIGSNASLAGAPGIVAYGAAKAFGAALAEGLWAELRSCGIDVLALSLGVTRTPNLLRAGSNLDALGLSLAEPDEVADQGLQQLGRGPTWHVTGNEETVNRLRSPDRLAAIGMMGKGLSAVSK